MLEHGIDLNLQFFADGGEEPQSGQPEPKPTEGRSPTSAPAANPAPAPTLTPEQLGKLLTDAIDKRTQRAENGVVRSIAEQYGLDEDEVKGILEKAKAAKAGAAPEALKQRLDQMQQQTEKRLINAEVRVIGAQMGLRDVADALLMMDQSQVKVDGDGAVTGVKEALEALKTSKPYLFGEEKKPGAWGLPVEKKPPEQSAWRQKAKERNANMYGAPKQ